MYKRYNVFITVVILFFLVGLVSGCADGNNPTEPTLNSPVKVSGGASGTDSHYLVGFSYIYIDATDPGNIEHEIIPVRDVAMHWNILKWLEDGPCTDCFKLVGFTQSGTGTLLVDVQVDSPFPLPNFTGFDVRGIAMFNAGFDFPESGLNFSDRNLGDGAVVNADGFTTLYNGTTAGSGPAGLQGYYEGKFSTMTAPDGLLNGYKRYISDDPSNTRNAFLAGESITETFEIDMPDSGFIFGYAVDANWEPPITKPVTDPMTDFGPGANCPEPWKIEVTSEPVNPLGSAEVTIDVYDWQGKATLNAPVLECPDLFTGNVEAVFDSDGTGYTRYRATVTNEKAAPDGSYHCLVSVEDTENDPANKPWLDLTAYQVFEIEVAQEFSTDDVTPLWLNSHTEDYEVSGDYLFIGAGFNGVQVYDVSDPDNPVWVKNIDVGSQVWEISISGGYMYVAGYSSDLGIVDIDPLEEAYVVTDFSLDGATFSVASNGTTAFVGSATYPDGLVHVVDTSDPESPVLMASVPYPGFPKAMVYQDGYVYHAAGAGGLHIIDVDPPASATLVNTIATTGSCREVAVDSLYAYACDHLAGLHIIDIDPPDTASIVDTVAVPDNAYGVDVSGAYVYVAAMSDGVQIIEVDPGGTGTIVNTVAAPFWLQDSRIGGNYLYAGTDGGTVIIDITDPMTASVQSRLDYPGYIRDLDSTSDRVLAANNDAGILILDTTIPAEAQPARTLDTGVTTAVTISGNTAYVIGSSDLVIIDLATPGSEAVVNTVDLPDSNRDIAIDSGMAYVASGYDGLQIVDVDPPGTAAIIGSAATTYEANAVAVQGGYAYVSTRTGTDSAFSVVDIDPPGSASEVHTVSLDNEPYEIGIYGDYALVANASDGLTVMDISDPLTATLVDSFSFTGSAIQGIEIVNNYAFLADYTTGLDIVDISDPASPVLMTNQPLKGYKFNLSVEDDHAYVAGGPAGVRIVSLW